MPNTLDSIKAELDNLKTLTAQAVTQLQQGTTAPPANTDQAEIDAMASEIADLTAQLQTALSGVPTPGPGGIPPASNGPSAGPTAPQGVSTTNPPTIPGSSVPPSSPTSAGSPPSSVMTPPSLVGAAPPVGQSSNQPGANQGTPLPPAQG